jgi:hypothetical protein
MKRKQTFAILIWAYRGKQKENEATLYARVTVNGIGVSSTRRGIILKEVSELRIQSSQATK